MGATDQRIKMAWVSLPFCWCTATPLITAAPSWIAHWELTYLEQNVRFEEVFLIRKNDVMSEEGGQVPSSVLFIVTGFQGEMCFHAGELLTIFSRARLLVIPGGFLYSVTISSYTRRCFSRHLVFIKFGQAQKSFCWHFTIYFADEEGTCCTLSNLAGFLWNIVSWVKR